MTSDQTQVIQWFFAGTFFVTFPQPIIFCPCLFLHCLHNTSLSPLTSTIKKILRNVVFWMTPSCCLFCSNATTPEDAVNILHNIFCTLSLPLFPFVRGEVMPATFSLPHLLVFSTLLCLVSSSSSLPPLLPSSHLSLHSPPISALASLVSSCPALVTLPLSSVIGHRPSFLHVQPTADWPTVICS